MIREIPITLLRLPTEVLQQIFLYLPVQDLYQNVDFTCKRLRDSAYPVYRSKYGRGPAPVTDEVNKWKLFALRNEVFLKHTDGTRDETIDDFLRIYINYPNDHIIEDTENIIYYLHENPNQGLEAIIAALNVQQRREESLHIWREYGDSLTADGKARLQARFDLDFRVSWDDYAVGVLNQCLLAAVTTDNMGLFSILTELIIEKRGEIAYLEASLAASRSGIPEMLQYLLGTFDIKSNTKHLDDLLETAIKFNRAHIAKVLLDSGLFISLTNPYKRALNYGYVDVLYQFRKHSSDIIGTYFGNGELQIAYALMYGQNSDATIKFLVKDVSADINAVGRDGLAAVHVAAENGLIEELNLLSTLGADMSTCGFIQQTAMEIAYCNQHKLPLDPALPKDIISLKQNLSKMILGKLKDQRVKHLATTYNKKASECESAYEDAEYQLAAIWTRKIGLQTMQQLHRKLETSLYTSVVRVYGMLMHFDKVLCSNNQLRGEVSIKDAVEGLLPKSLQEQHLACCGSDVLTREDTTNFLSFMKTDAGCALTLRQASFHFDEIRIWLRLEARVENIQG
ncbi:uncharacterized protein BDV14DRAFT_180617 [Aspergillus stella-maris]|uniref:uncharacterized protein n=1 Tax=Aspergillus stella-maris TaxID=1810926 RepID=UPI003CCDCAB1